MTDKKYTYPKNEQVWERLFARNGELLFIITSKRQRDFYFLYQLIDDKFVKLGKASSPRELKDKFDVDKKCG